LHLPSPDPDPDPNPDPNPEPEPAAIAGVKGVTTMAIKVATDNSVTIRMIFSCKSTPTKKSEAPAEIVYLFNYLQVNALTHVGIRYTLITRSSRWR